MRSILRCIICGSPVQSLGRTGPVFSTICPGCGTSSASLAANYMNNISGKDIEVIRYSSQQRRAIPSEYP